MISSFSGSDIFRGFTHFAPIFSPMDTGQILAEILVAGAMRIHLIGVAG